MKSPVRVGAIVVLCMLAIAGAGALFEWRPWDARLGAGAAARALQQKLHTKVPYRCERASSDVGDKLKDVDYVCIPARPARLPGYWIATDNRRITGVEPVH